jgi:hypothetical protein
MYTCTNSDRLKTPSQDAQGPWYESLTPIQILSGQQNQNLQNNMQQQQQQQQQQDRDGDRVLESNTIESIANEIFIEKQLEAYNLEKMVK